MIKQKIKQKIKQMITKQKNRTEQNRIHDHLKKMSMDI